MISKPLLPLLLLLRIAILASPFVLFAGAFVYHLNSTGIREAVYTLDRPTALISPLFPARRLEGIKNGRQLVREEPIYFTVRALRPYETAEVMVRVVNPKQLVWKIGVAVDHDDNWAYELHEPSPDGAVSLGLMGVPRENNTYRFIISAPGLVATDGFQVAEIRVKLTGLTGVALMSQIIDSVSSR